MVKAVDQRDRGTQQLLVVGEEIQAKAIGGDLVFLAVLQRTHEEQETTNEDL